MVSFCTLFNKGYLSRGLSMYDSLRYYVSTDFILYILAIDDETYEYLVQAKLEHIIPIRLSDFESPELLTVKSGRTFQEYCWTCTPWIVKYVLEVFKPSSCTYLDADLYFFGDPVPFVLSTERKEGVSITPHRYTKLYDQTDRAGKYCVQFLTFSNTPCAREVLESWSRDCINWCFAKYEPGLFGDQKYLDFWEEKFSCIDVIEDPRIGLAPWNIQQYKLNEVGDLLFDENKLDAIFYHFHYTKFLSENIVDAGPYEIESKLKLRIYGAYLKQLKINKAITVRCNLESWHEVSIPFVFSRDFLRFIKRLFNNRKNLLYLRLWPK